MTRLAALLGIRSEESQMVLETTAIFFVVQVSSAFSANATDALFFSKFGVDRLPPMIVVAGLVVMTVLLVHSAGIGRYGAASWLPAITATSAILAFVSWMLSLSNAPWSYPVIWVGSQAIIWLTFSIMWNGAAASCDTRQAKRLYPLFASGGVAGAILGNLLTGVVAGFTGTEGLLAVQSLLLAAVTIQMWRAARTFRGSSGIGHSVIGELRSAGRTIAASRLLKRVSATAFGFSTLFFLVVFPFNEAVAARFDTATETAAFLGVFSSLATAATFITSLLIAKRLFARIGIVVSMLAVPLVYSLGFATWLWRYDLTTASMVRGAQWVVVNAIGGTAMFSLYNVLSGRRRGQVAAFVTAVPTQLGIVAGGLILTTPWRGRAMFTLGLVLGLMVFLLVLGTRSAYVSALMKAVNDGLVGVFRAPHPTVTSPLGRESAALLVSLLKDPSSHAKLIGIASLGAAGDPDHVPALTPLLEHENPRIRVATLDALDVLDPEDIGEILLRCLDDPDPAMRSHALRSLAARNEMAGREAALDMLEDTSATVSAAAAWLVGDRAGEQVIAGLLKSRDSVSVIAALEAAPSATEILDLADLAEHPDSRVRRLVVARTQDLGVLRRSLDDPSVSVRREAGDRLAETEQGRALLVEMVEGGNVTEAETALKALTSNGHIAGTLTDWALNETARASYLRTAAVNLSSIDTPSASFLVDVLGNRSQRLAEWVLIAMATPDKAEQMDAVHKALWSEDAELRAQALEALDSLGDSKVSGPLLVLLESGETSGHATPETLERLSGDFDPWIAALATKVLNELKMTEPGALVETLSDSPPMDERSEILERMIALSKTPMFSNLDPEDLELVAEAASEEHYLAGEKIYEVGEAAEDMLFLVSGSVDVTVGDGTALRHIASYGPGAHVGELALLQRATRSADVSAGEEGTTALKLTADDLQAALEERPSVAIAMLTTLAARIAEQTKELQAASAPVEDTRGH